jgi:hypothetical protein
LEEMVVVYILTTPYRYEYVRRLYHSLPAITPSPFVLSGWGISYPERSGVVSRTRSEAER